MSKAFSKMIECVQALGEQWGEGKGHYSVSQRTGSNAINVCYVSPSPVDKLIYNKTSYIFVTSYKKI